MIFLRYVIVTLVTPIIAYEGSYYGYHDILFLRYPFPTPIAIPEMMCLALLNSYYPPDYPIAIPEMMLFYTHTIPLTILTAFDSCLCT